ncbi:MAG: hypothetical protein K2K37_05375 [Muribaculaceae bacterium]|nr:hypothetical protein [Muribaculaceae bacterium]
MNKPTYLLAVSAISLMPMFTSCGGDDPDEPGFTNGEVPWDGKSERAYLEETASKVLGYFNPSDQSTLIRSLDYFVHVCRTDGLPDLIPEKVLSAPSVAYAADGSRASSDFVVDLGQLNGFYQHNAGNGTWQKLEDSDDLRFRYWIGESEFNMSLSGSSDTWSTTFTTEGQQMELVVPKVLDLTLVSGSTSVTSPNTILTMKLKTDFKDAERLNMSAEIKAANVFIETSANGNNTSMDVNLKISIDNVQTYYRYTLVHTKTHIAGGGLCSIATWQKAAGDYGSVISSLTNNLMVLQNVQVKSEVIDMKKFMANFVPWFGGSDGSDASMSAEAAAKALTASIKADMYFAGDKNKIRAFLGWEAYKDADFAGGEGVQPTITFTSDDVSYSFEAYFGNDRFLSVENKFKKLYNQYVPMFQYNK